MDRNNIDKIAKTPEDRLLLAKVWDKINAGLRKGIPANSCFLSPRELEMTRLLFGEPEGLHRVAVAAEAVQALRLAKEEPGHLQLPWGQEAGIGRNALAQSCVYFVPDHRKQQPVLGGFCDFIDVLSVHTITLGHYTTAICEKEEIFLVSFRKIRYNV